jgi:Tfp pilus assembly protein PilO
MIFERKRILFLSVAALASVIFAVFGYIPIAWQKHVIHQTLRRQSLTMEQIRTSTGQAAVLEQKITELEPLSQRFDRCIPEDHHFASFWQQIAELMTRHELQNQQVQPGVETRQNQVSIVSIDIRCNGTLPRIFEFVRSLEKMDRLVRIRWMELENDKDLTGQLTFSARAEVFYRTPESQKAG